MDKKNWPVHERHCCPKHGCKYGDKDCPVANGLTKKHNKHCEDCEHEAKYPHEFVTPDEYQKGQAAIEALELLEKYISSSLKIGEHIGTEYIIQSERRDILDTLYKLHTPEGRERIRKELEG